MARHSFIALCIVTVLALPIHAFQRPSAIAQRGSSLTILPKEETTRSTRLFSDSTNGESTRNIGATEQLLLEKAHRRNQGYRQEYGKTIKKDGLDGLRGVVWALFEVSQVVFGVLGVLLSLGFLLNMMGMGYYWDHGSLVIDNLDHIRQERVLQQEAIRLGKEYMSSGM